MSFDELTTSNGASNLKSGAPTDLTKAEQGSRFNAVILGVGALTFFFLLLVAGIVGNPHPQAVQVVTFLGGLIAGFTLGTVFGLWIGRNIGYEPKPKKFSLATGIVTTSACIGFFGFPYATTGDFWLLVREWPIKDSQTLVWSIGVAGTLVSASMFCLVNFAWHTRDQRRAHVLRAMLSKERAKTGQVTETSEKLRNELDEANANVGKRDKELADAIAKIKTLEVNKTRIPTGTPKPSPGDHEDIWKRWHQDLIGKWKCEVQVAFMYLDQGNTITPADKEKLEERNHDEVELAADGTLEVYHPGTNVVVRNWPFGRKADESDYPFRKMGDWDLDGSAKTVKIRLADGSYAEFYFRFLNKDLIVAHIGDWPKPRLFKRQKSG